MATIPASVSDQVLVDFLKAELQNASVQVQDLFAEMVERWSATSAQVTQAAVASIVATPGVGVRLNVKGIKLGKPETFTGAPAALENWLFNVKQFREVHGITEGIYLDIRHVMAESDALYLYVRGLKAQVQAQVMMQNPPTLEDAMKIVDSADSAIWFSNRMIQRAPNPNPTPNPARLSRPPLPQPPNWQTPMELGVVQGRPLPQQGQRTHLTCYGYGQIGHIKRNCPLNAQHQPPYQQPGGLWQQGRANYIEGSAIEGSGQPEQNSTIQNSEPQFTLGQLQQYVDAMQEQQSRGQDKPQGYSGNPFLDDNVSNNWA